MHVFQRLHPTVLALVKYSRIVFVSQALKDFVLLEGFGLTLFFLVFSSSAQYAPPTTK